jgi:hypothetical protein
MTEEKLIDSVVKDIKALPTLDQYGLVSETTVEIEPQRRVAGVGAKGDPDYQKDKWTRGVIDTQFSVNSGKRWIPAKSYFKASVALTTNSAQPKSTDAITLASGFMNNIIASCSFYIGNVCVSRCDDYVGQQSMMKYRTQKDLNWLKSIGKDVFYVIQDFSERQRQTDSDGHLEKIIYSQLGYADNNLFEDTTLTQVRFTQGAGTALPPTNTIWRVGDKIQYIPKEATARSADGDLGIVRTVTAVNNTTNTLTLSPARDWILTGTIDMSQAKVYRIRDAQEPIQSTDRRNRVQVLFQLPLGIFDANGSVLPQGEMRFKITPKSDKIGAVETYYGVDLPTDWDLNITDFALVNTVFSSTKTFADDSYYLQLEEWELQNRKLNPGSSLTTHNFTLPPGTNKIVVFAQDTGSGSPDTPWIPPSVFKSSTGNASDDLRHIQITFGGKTMPATLIDSSFVNSTNNLTQRYMWNAENNGFRDVGGETFDDWLSAGIIQSFEFHRPVGDMSTQCQIQIDYANMTDECELFVAANYTNLVKVTTESGLITDVQIQHK